MYNFNLNILVLVPLLTLVGIMAVKKPDKARIVAAIGMSVQLVLVFVLLFMYLAERKAGNTDEVLFFRDYTWYDSLNIHYILGVDGIAVGMIVLTGIIIFAGVFASWLIDDLPKDFFFWLVLLAMGVFGFFTTLDLFVLFLYFELAVIPMYLLIGLWGTGPKEYSAMKLTLMLMGASALLIVGILGIYFNSAPDGGALTFNILEISKISIPIEVQKFFFPLIFIGFGVISALFPFHTWSPDGHASAPTAVSMLHAGVLMKLG
ncbi:MAG: proton-conducting transporter membrane subunit, partial [Cyclobacteriaceae bacterium]|nr:proton-conducting transporter membrane subunit [Cyclobacteriaceae bacterium]